MKPIFPGENFMQQSCFRKKINSRIFTTSLWMKMPLPKNRLHKKHYAPEEDEKAQDLLVYQLVKK